jgi:DNA-binding NtrC family response regulator
MARILVVDDEVGIRELLSEILYDEGHTVDLAENAAAARALRNQHRPDVVLLDIWMPDTDGVTLLKEWASQGLLDMPVIMMSGHATIDTAVEATRIGASDFLEKPITMTRLLKTIASALDRGRAGPKPAAVVRAAAHPDHRVGLRPRADRCVQRGRIAGRNGAGGWRHPSAPAAA